MATMTTMRRSAMPRTSRTTLVCKASLVPSFKQAAAAAVCTGMLLASPAFAADGVKFQLSNNASVSSPVHLEMQVSGMTVKPASEGLVPKTGHFHVLLDDASVPEEGEAIPFDDAHLHFGKGQTAADVVLTPGKHKLTLQFANALHQSYGPAWAQTVTVNVK